jgi:hypothetical protein
MLSAKSPHHYFAPPLPQHPITPGWNKQNGWMGIPYYQQFVEFTIHLINLNPGF